MNCHRCATDLDDELWGHYCPICHRWTCDACWSYAGLCRRCADDCRGVWEKQKEEAREQEHRH